MKNNAKHPSCFAKDGAGVSKMAIAGDIRSFYGHAPKMSGLYTLLNKKLAQICANDFRPLKIVNRI